MAKSSRKAKQEELEILQESLTEESEEEFLRLRKKGKRVLRLNYTLQILTILTMIGSIILYFTEEERGLDITLNHIFQCAGALIVFNIPIIISKKFRCFIPNFITLTLYIFAFAHFVLGEIYRAYDNVFLYDKILHTTGGVIFAILSFSVIWLLNNSESKKVKLSPFFIVLFTFCFTMTVEYLWELVEYGMDRLFGLNMQRWQDGLTQLADGRYVTNPPYGSGLKDSMGDMFVNVIGCFVVCAISYLGMKRKPDWFENKVILTEKQFQRIKLEHKHEDIVDLPPDSEAAIAKREMEEQEKQEERKEPQADVRAAEDRGPLLQEQPEPRQKRSQGGRNSGNEKKTLK